MPRPDRRYDVPQFGPALRRAREARGMSQQQLADAIGMLQTSIGKLELGHTDPRLGVAVALARVLRVPLARLLEDGK